MAIGTMLTRLLLATGVLVTLALGACSSTVQTEGTNTNWVTCRTDSDCTKVASTSACVSGVCQLADGGKVLESEEAGGGDASSSACTGPLAQSGCAATYDGALAAVTCPSPAPVSQTVGTCGAFRTVARTDVDVVSTCAYDSSGALTAAKTCSKPIGGCGCFSAGDPAILTCESGSSRNACAADAGVNSDGGTVASLPACTWPSELDGDASSRAFCHAARVYLSCDLPGGVTELCTTDGVMHCTDSGTSPCHPKCASNEYVASCGGVGPGPVPDPPSGCRSMGANPGGTAYYCCPCGS